MLFYGEVAMYRIGNLGAKEAIHVLIASLLLSIFVVALSFVHTYGQSASDVTVMTSPSPADFIVERPNKTVGSLLFENTSDEAVDIVTSKSGSNCNNLAYWSEFPWLQMGAIGHVDAQSSKAVSFAVDSRYLVPGEYSALLCFSDRANADTTIDPIRVTFTVQEGEGPAVEAVETDKDRYAIGVQDGIRIPAKALFDDGTKTTIGRDAQWSSSDNSVATVDRGWVKGVAAGEAEIAVTFGDTSATATVRVEDGPAELSVEPESIEVSVVQGRSVTQELTLSNVGGSWMDWNITFAKGQDCSDTSRPEKPWLEISGEDEVGRLAPGASVKPRFSLLGYNFYDSAEHLAVGEHQSMVCIATNNPENPVTEVPITLTVTTPPQIDIFSPDWQFYTLPTSGSYAYRHGDGDNMIEIMNRGEGTLEWEAYVASGSCDNPTPGSWLQLEETSGTTEPGEVSYLFFNPHAAGDEIFELGDYGMLFCITSNDPENPLVTASLQLSVVEPHDMPIDYLHLENEGTDTLQVGEETQLNAIKYVFSGHDFNVNDEATWTSSNESVATVSASGRVTAVGPGRVTITARYENRTDTVALDIIEAETPEEPESEQPDDKWQVVKDWIQKLIDALRKLFSHP